MIHLDEGTLQAYLDHELPMEQRKEADDHLAKCSDCSRLLQELHSMARTTEKVLSEYRLLMSNQQENNSEPNTKLSDSFNLAAYREQLQNQRRRKRLALAAAASVLLIFVSFQPVRSLASEWLTVFRSQNVEFIQVQSMDIARIINGLQEEGLTEVDLKHYGQLNVTGSPTAEITIADMQELTGIRLPAELQGLQMIGLYGDSGASLHLKPKVKKINQLLHQLGSEYLLPTTLEGEEITINLPIVFHASYSLEDWDQAEVNQRSSHGKPSEVYLHVASLPEIHVPNDVNVQEAAGALSQLPIFPHNIRQQLMKIEDWQKTLPLPVRDEMQQWTVHGVKVMLHEGGTSSNAVWLHKGYIFELYAQNVDLRQVIASIIDSSMNAE